MACSFHRRHIQEWKPVQSSCNRVLLDCPAHQPAIREHCSNTAGQQTHSCSSHSSSPLTSSPANHSLEALADFGASQVGKIFYLPFDTRGTRRAKLIKGFRHWTLGMDVSLKKIYTGLSTWKFSFITCNTQQPKAEWKEGCKPRRTFLLPC